LNLATVSVHKEFVELFLAAGAYVDAKDENGETALDKAKRYFETSALLRRHGGKTNEESKAAANWAS